LRYLTLSNHESRSIGIWYPKWGDPKTMILYVIMDYDKISWIDLYLFACKNGATSYK